MLHYWHFCCIFAVIQHHKVTIGFFFGIFQKCVLVITFWKYHGQKFSLVFIKSNVRHKHRHTREFCYIFKNCLVCDWIWIFARKKNLLFFKTFNNSIACHFDNCLRELHAKLVKLGLVPFITSQWFFFLFHEFFWSIFKMTQSSKKWFVTPTLQKNTTKIDQLKLMKWLGDKDKFLPEIVVVFISRFFRS